MARTRAVAAASPVGSARAGPRARPVLLHRPIADPADDTDHSSLITDHQVLIVHHLPGHWAKRTGPSCLLSILLSRSPPSSSWTASTARITIGKRTDTVVEVLPGNGSDEDDVRAVQQTRVSCSGGRLTVRTPKKRSLFGKPGTVVVSIELPAGSDVRGTSALGGFFCEGPLGEVKLTTSLGDLQVDRAARAELRTDHGDIRLERSAGDAEVVGSGRIEVGAVAGAAVVKNSNGTTGIDEAGGELKVNAANGDISVGVAHGDVVAKSANGRIEIGVARAGVDATSSNGRIRVGDVTRGRIALRTSVGDLEVGIHEGTAAWLDLNPKFGTVRNELGAAAGPEDSDETVEVHARAEPATSSSAAPELGRAPEPGRA